MRSNGIAGLALCLALATAGCHKRVPVATLPPPPSVPVAVTVPSLVPPPAAEPLPPPPPAPVPNVSPLDQADRAFNSGSYEEAGRLYENYLRATPSGGSRDRAEALFHLALTYALRPAPGTDWQRASATFKQLLEEFPDTPLRAQANLLLAMRTELDQSINDAKQTQQSMKKLTTELDRLKKIDADRRKRP